MNTNEKLEYGKEPDVGRNLLDISFLLKKVYSDQRIMKRRYFSK